MVKNLKIIVAMLGLLCFCFLGINLIKSKEDPFSAISTTEQTISLAELEHQIELAKKGDSSALNIVNRAYVFNPDGTFPYESYIELANYLNDFDIKKQTVLELKGRTDCTTALLDKTLAELSYTAASAGPRTEKACTLEVGNYVDAILRKFTF